MYICISLSSIITVINYCTNQCTNTFSGFYKRIIMCVYPSTYTVQDNKKIHLQICTDLARTRHILINKSKI